ncbi:MAG: 16S rRNA (guanine(966)-N(2))-methyltransferase RsmD [Leptothrix sp. (in: b-proteobacteria)]
MRLIGGRWKRSKLEVADRAGLRPTPDRVRETLFNWLGQDLSGWIVLDAFAGSGALGFEAASRGAARVNLLERDADLVRRLQAAQQRLGASEVAIERGDALAWMAARPAAEFDLILLDPPYAQDLFAAALTAALRLLRPDGWIYLEADRAFVEADLAAMGLTLRRSGRAGVVHYHLLARRPAAIQDSVSHYTAAASPDHPTDPRSSS